MLLNSAKMEDRMNTVDLFNDVTTDSVCVKCNSTTEECFSLMSENRRLKELIKEEKNGMVMENQQKIDIENQHLRDLVNYYKKEKKTEEDAMIEVIRHCDKLQEDFEKLQKEREDLMISFETEKQIIIGEKRALKIKITELLDLKLHNEKVQKVYQSTTTRQSKKLTNLQLAQDMLINACDFFDHNYGTLNGKYWKCALCQHNCHASDIYKHCLRCIKLQDFKNV